MRIFDSTQNRAHLEECIRVYPLVHPITVVDSDNFWYLLYQVAAENTGITDTNYIKQLCAYQGNFKVTLILSHQ